MKNWKKLLSLCLALIMMLGLLSACGQEPTETSHGGRRHYSLSRRRDG